jgi:hypothetical protein
MKVQHYWLYSEVWLFNFRLVWPVDATGLSKYIKDEFGKDIDFGLERFGGKSLVIVGKRHTTYLVALKHWRGTADDHACLAHECLHTANNVLQDRGVHADWENDEAQAYLCGYLVRECLNQLLPAAKRVQVDARDVPKKAKKRKK